MPRICELIKTPDNLLKSTTLNKLGKDWIRKNIILPIAFGHIYWDLLNGSDTYDGATQNTPVKSWDRVISLLASKPNGSYTVSVIPRYNTVTPTKYTTKHGCLDYIFKLYLNNQYKNITVDFNNSFFEWNLTPINDCLNLYETFSSYNKFTFKNLNILNTITNTSKANYFFELGWNPDIERYDYYKYNTLIIDNVNLYRVGICYSNGASNSTIVKNTRIYGKYANLYIYYNNQGNINIDSTCYMVDGIKVGSATFNANSISDITADQFKTTYKKV